MILGPFEKSRFFAFFLNLSHGDRKVSFSAEVKQLSSNVQLPLVMMTRKKSRFYHTSYF